MFRKVQLRMIDGSRLSSIYLLATRGLLHNQYQQAIIINQLESYNQLYSLHLSICTIQFSNEKTKINNET